MSKEERYKPAYMRATPSGSSTAGAAGVDVPTLNFAPPGDSIQGPKSDNIIHWGAYIGNGY